MKKIFVVLIAILMIFSMVACNQPQTTEQNSETDNQSQTTSNNVDVNSNISTEKDTNTNSDTVTDTSIPPIGSIEELETTIEKDIESSINSLNSEWLELSQKITSFDEYVNNADAVKEFYDRVNDVNEQLCIRLQEYTIKYAEFIMSSDMSNDDKYDAFEDLEDCIYDDAADDLHDGIYDGLLEDMKDALYDGVLDDSDEAESYSVWYEFRSDEYENWYETRSDVYEDWYDTRSDIYSFYYDMRGDLYSDKVDDAEETLADYKKDVEKLK